MGDWKMQFPRKYRSLNGREGGKDGMPVKYEMNPVEANELYNLINDPEEKFNVYDKHPEIAKQMEELADQARFELGDRLTGIEGTENRELGK